MAVKKIKPGIYWVGAIDWKLRNFHGYLTQKGSTYNSYLIIDEKITLVDTVKEYFFEEMMVNIQELIDPSRIDYIVTNHVEMDHSGSLPKIADIAENAQIIISPNGEKILRKHFNRDWNFKVVNTGDTVNIGKRDLKFILAPMVHWPDSMATYVPEDKILLSNDAFGQHLASHERFDDECGLEITLHEAAKYYANIVLPYGAQVKKLLDTASALDIDIIAPSHGLMWRSNIPKIVELYKNWAENKTEKKAVIVYDTMWHSTEKMAFALKDVFTEKKIPTEMISLQETHISDIMTRLLSAEFICVGSPTLNNTLLPTVAQFLTYLKGLAPKGRKGIAFGSYGWGGQSIGEMEYILEKCKFDILIKGLKIQYVPRDEEIEDFKDKLKKAIN